MPLPQALQNLVDQESGGGAEWRVEPGSQSGLPSVLDKLVAEQNAARTVAPREITPDEKLPRAELGGQKLKVGPFSTPLTSPEWLERSLAQIGSGMADYGMLFKSPEEVDEKRRIDRGLNDDLTGKVLSFTGKIAPALAVPQLRGAQAVGDIATGAGIGAMEPVGTGESRGLNTVVGGAAGALAPALRGAGRAATRMSPEEEDLARAAIKYGFTLTPGNQSTNALVKAWKKIGDESIIPGMGSQGIDEANQQAFNRATAGIWGGTAPGGKVTGASRLSDKKRITDELDRVWSNNELPYTPDLFVKLQDMRNEALKQPAQIRDALLRNIDDFEGRFQPNANGDLVMPGDVANNFQKDIFKRYGKGNDPGLGYDMMQLRGHILDTFNTNIAGQDAAALTKARGQYRAFKALDSGANKSELGVAGRETGDIRPTDLTSGVLQAYKGKASPFDELSRVGQRYLVDRVPQTGGSAKAMLQNTAVGTAALGGLGALSLPAAVSAAGIGYGASRALRSPAALRAALGEERATALGLQGPGLAARLADQTARRLPPAGALSLLNLYGPEQ